MNIKSLITKSLSKRILLLAFLASSVVSLFISSYQGISWYFNLHKNFKEEQIRVQKIFAPAIADVVWNFDSDQAHALIDGLILNHGFVEVEISANTSIIAKMATKTPASYFKNYPIFSPKSSDKQIGVLKIGYNEAFIINHAIRDYKDLLISSFLQNLLVTFIIFILLNKFIITYIQKISNHLKMNFSWQARNPISLDRNFPTIEGDDEFAHLIKAINEMTTQIVDYQANKERLSSEIAEAQLQQRMTEVSNGLIHNLGNMLQILRGHIDKINRIFENNVDKISQEDQEVYYRYKDKVNRVYFSNLELLRTQQANAKRTLEVSLIPLSEIVEDIRILLDKNFHQSVKLNLNLATNEVFANRSQLTLVLLNLIKNSAEALDKSNVQDAMIWIDSLHTTGKTVIQVRDNGPGIPKELQEKLFTYGTSGKDDGHGFGLSSSRDVVRSWGGELEFISADFRAIGAIFQITIPEKQPIQNIPAKTTAA